jgi:hypothetical protein
MPRLIRRVIEEYEVEPEDEITLAEEDDEDDDLDGDELGEDDEDDADNDDEPDDDEEDAMPVRRGNASRSRR